MLYHQGVIKWSVESGVIGTKVALPVDTLMYAIIKCPIEQKEAFYTFKIKRQRVVMLMCETSGLRRMSLKYDNGHFMVNDADLNGSGTDIVVRIMSKETMFDCAENAGKLMGVIERLENKLVDLEDKLVDLEDKLMEVYYMPNAPAYERAKASFIENSGAPNREVPFIGETWSSLHTT